LLSDIISIMFEPMRSSVLRSLAGVCGAVLIVASCGGEPEARTSNRTLNSVTCYQTQADKDGALATAESALAAARPPLISPDSTPTLSDASSGEVGQLAFIGPVQWWKRLPRATDSTTTTTTVASTATVASTEESTTTTTTVAESTSTSEPASRFLNAPTDVQAVVDGTTVRVSWTAPEASNTPVEDYAFLWTTDGFRSLSSWRVSGTSVTSPSFAPGTTVQFQVRADNDTYRVYSGWSNVASATIASAAVEETTTTVAVEESSGEENDSSVETFDLVALAELRSQVNLIRETPLCADLEAAAEIECAVLAGFDADRPELASITTCADADEVRVQYDGGFGAGTAAGNEVFLMNVGAVDQFVFQVARAGVVIASGTVQRGDTQSFTGIDQASLVAPETTVGDEEGVAESVECDASAGLDLNVGIAYVDPCDAATAVQITFDGAASGDIQTVSNGSRASVPNPDRVGFTFEVYVGNDVAVSGSVAYPTEPAVITTTRDCDISVADAGSDIIIRSDCEITSVDLEAYNAGINGRWLNSYRGGNFTMRKWVADSSYTFTFKNGETTVELVTIYDGESASATVTFAEQIYADIESDFSGSIEPVVNDTGSEEETGGTGDLVPLDGYVICTATASVYGARFSCARPLQVQFRSTVRERIFWFEGDETSVFGPVENAENGSVFVFSKATNEVVLDVRAWGGALGTAELEYQFYVPDLDVPVYEEGPYEEGPYFEGWFTPDFPSDTVLTFTVPNDYSADYFELTLAGDIDEAGDCLTGEFGAVLRAPSGDIVAQFVGAPWGGCAVGLYAEGLDPEGFRGQSFEVVVYEVNPDETPWEGSIEWWGTVDLSYGGGSGFVEGPEEESVSDVVWYETGTMVLDAPQSHQFVVGAGGVFFEFRGNTLQFEERDCREYVYPYLKLEYANGVLIAEDYRSGEGDEGTGLHSALLRGFLPEGSYTLVATTDLYSRMSGCGTVTQYQLAWRWGRLVATGVVEEQDPTGVTTTTTTTTVPQTSTTTTTTTTVPSTEESTEESTTTTTTTVPSSTTTTVPVTPVDIEPVLVPLSEPPTNLQPDPPRFAMPVNELRVLVPDEISAEEPAQPTEASIGIPSTLRELVCDEACVELLLEEAGVDEAAIEITLGSQSTVIDGVKRRGAVAIRPGARQLTVTITPTDGSAPVVLTRDVVVLSPRVAPTKIAETASLAVSKKVPQSNRLPLVLALVVALIVLAGAGSVLARRRKGQAAA